MIKKERLVKAGLAFAVFSLSFLHAEAKRAYQGLIEMELPDGTSLPISLVGDERGHYAMSEDGYVLAEDSDGFYYYAQVEDGRLESTGVRCHPIAMRGNTEIRLAASLNKETLVSAANLMIASTPRNQERVAYSSSSPAKGPGLYNTKGFPAKGEPRALVLLVSFADKDFTTENPHDYFTRQLNEEGFSDNDATGSVRDFFVYNSMGLFNPQFDVYGPVTVSNNCKYYGENTLAGDDRYPGKMVEEACQLLDDEIDFSIYDSDGDGYVDNVYVYYAGKGEADGGGTNTIWPHQYTLTWANGYSITLDGVTIDSYGCSNEIDNSTKIADGIGTFVHEFSHVIGLPDLYSTNYSNSFTPGSFSTLDYGPYNNNGRTPPNYSSYERYALDWIEPTPLTAGEGRLEPVDKSNYCYIVTNPENNDEFFLFENRQQENFDAYIPGHGMLVWHVDYVPKIWEYNNVNNTPSHQYVDLIEADNKRSENNRNGDPFPGKSNITSFGYDTSPSLQTWAKENLFTELSKIAEEDGIITFTCTSEPPVPVLPLEEVNIFAGLADNAELVSTGMQESDEEYIYEGVQRVPGNGYAILIDSEHPNLSTPTLTLDKEVDEGILKVYGGSRIVFEATEEYKGFNKLNIVVRDKHLLNQENPLTVTEGNLTNSLRRLSWSLPHDNDEPVPSVTFTLPLPAGYDEEMQTASTWDEPYMEIVAVELGGKNLDTETFSVATAEEVLALNPDDHYSFNGRMAVVGVYDGYMYTMDTTGYLRLDADDNPFSTAYEFGDAITKFSGDMGLHKASPATAKVYEETVKLDSQRGYTPVSVGYDNIEDYLAADFAPYSYIRLTAAWLIRVDGEYVGVFKGGDQPIRISTALSSKLPDLEKRYNLFGIMLPTETGDLEFAYINYNTQVGVESMFDAPQISVYVENDRIIAPAGSRICDISGRIMNADHALPSGVYIVTTPSGVSVKLIVK